MLDLYSVQRCLRRMNRFHWRNPLYELCKTYHFMNLIEEFSRSGTWSMQDSIWKGVFSSIVRVCSNMVLIIVYPHEVHPSRVSDFPQDCCCFQPKGLPGFRITTPQWHYYCFTKIEGAYSRSLMNCLVCLHHSKYAQSSTYTHCYIRKLFKCLDTGTDSVNLCFGSK